jgi:uncharacterized membrane protein YozB (DUF420 family)
MEIPGPTFHALLNATSGAFLTFGYAFIRRKNVRGHLACMILALAASLVFLVSYVVYHSQAGSTPFQGTGWARPVYFTILISHTVLATVVLPMAIVTVYQAARRRFDRHRRIARWTFPIWLYVSVTGILVYMMLYVWFAPA